MPPAERGVRNCHIAATGSSRKWQISALASAAQQVFHKKVVQRLDR